MASPPLLLLQDITLTLGGAPLLNGAGFGVGPGERICLVGRNGCGKSTLLRIAAGEIQADDGTVFIQPGTTVRYLPQEPDLSGFATTLDYVRAGMGPGDPEYRAELLLTELGLNGTEDPATLSGGEARRCALARALAPEPDLLCWTNPPTIWTCPPLNGWSANCCRCLPPWSS